MPNSYEAAHSNGQNYTVTTDRHHGDYSDRDFKEHLHGVIQGTFSTVIGGAVLRYIFKGKV
jgi:hypothetical protein